MKDAESYSSEFSFATDWAEKRKPRATSIESVRLTKNLVHKGSQSRATCNHELLMVELAEIFRLHGPGYRARFGSRIR